MHYFVSDRLNLLETYIGNQLFSYFFLDTPWNGTHMELWQIYTNIMEFVL